MVPAPPTPTPTNTSGETLWCFLCCFHLAPSPPHTKEVEAHLAVLGVPSSSSGNSPETVATCPSPEEEEVAVKGGTTAVDEDGSRAFRSNQFLLRVGIKLERSESDETQVARIMRCPSWDPYARTVEAGPGTIGSSSSGSRSGGGIGSSHGSTTGGDLVTSSGDAHLAKLHVACRSTLAHLTRLREAGCARSEGSGVTDSSGRSSFCHGATSNPLMSGVKKQGLPPSLTVALASQAAGSADLMLSPFLASAVSSSTPCPNGEDCRDDVVAEEDEEDEEEDDEEDMGKMVDVTIAYSEVLQLQQNIPEAIDVVSKLRDELRANPLHRRHHMQCLRRLGVLHKVSSQLADAEASVREYIALCGDSDTGNGGGDGDAHGSDALANAYTLLATIIDEAGGRPHEALAADKVAMEIMKKGRPCM